LYKNGVKCLKIAFFGVISRDEDQDLFIFGPPDPDPTCNNGIRKLFLSMNKI